MNYSGGLQSKPYSSHGVKTGRSHWSRITEVIHSNNRIGMMMGWYGSTFFDIYLIMLHDMRKETI